MKLMKAKATTHSNNLVMIKTFPWDDTIESYELHYFTYITLYCELMYSKLQKTDPIQISYSLLLKAKSRYPIGVPIW